MPKEPGPPGYRPNIRSNTLPAHWLVTCTKHQGCEQNWLPCSLKAQQTISCTWRSNLLNQDPSCTPGIFSMRGMQWVRQEPGLYHPYFPFLAWRSLGADLQFLSVNLMSTESNFWPYIGSSSTATAWIAISEPTYGALDWQTRRISISYSVESKRLITLEIVHDDSHYFFFAHVISILAEKVPYTPPEAPGNFWNR